MNMVKEYIDEILLLAGCGCIVYGLALWNATVAWVAAGLLMFGWAFLIGKVRSSSNEPTE
jgi:hypothetical protein